jgi:hypothetical protein
VQLHECRPDLSEQRLRRRRTHAAHLRALRRAAAGRLRLQQVRRGQGHARVLIYVVRDAAAAAVASAGAADDGKQAGNVGVAGRQVLGGLVA